MHRAGDGWDENNQFRLISLCPRAENAICPWSLFRDFIMLPYSIPRPRPSTYHGPFVLIGIFQLQRDCGCDAFDNDFSRQYLLLDEARLNLVARKEGGSGKSECQKKKKPH